MKIIYVNCGVKIYLKEGHCSCIRNLCMQLRKESLKKIQAVNVDHAQELTGMGKGSTGLLTVRHVFIKETSFFESNHIYFSINLSLAFLSRCFCSFYGAIDMYYNEYIVLVVALTCVALVPMTFLIIL